MKKVIELIRVSTEGQAADGRASIPAQRAVNRRTCAQYGLEIVKSIEMTDVSGAAVLRAPEMQELLRLIESPDIHGVVVKEFSRVMRPDNFSDYILFQAFQDSGTWLYLPDGPLDLNSRTGKLVAGLRAIIAGNELSEIRERIWLAKEEKRRQGKHPNNEICLPFGVGYHKERGWFYEPEAERIREAFSLYLAGTPLVSICRQLGLRRHLVTYALKNPIYTGWRIWDMKTDPSSSGRRATADGRQANRKLIKRTSDEIIRKKVIEPGLVSEAEFQRVQDMMSARAGRHFRANPTRPGLFVYGGFLRCSACGDPIQVAYQKGGYYVCGTKIRANKASSYGDIACAKMPLHVCSSRYMRRDLLEPKLDDLFGTRLTDRGFICEIVEEAESRSKQSGHLARVNRLQANIRGLQEKRERVLDMYVEGTLNREQRDARLAKLDQDLSVFRSLLLRETPDELPSVDELVAIVEPLAEFSFLSREQKRRILSAMTPEVHVADYKIAGVSLPRLTGYTDAPPDHPSSA